MRQFGTWFSKDVGGGRVYPTDLDLLLHDKARDRFCLVEFKPVGKEISVGQTYVLRGFSELRSPRSQSECVAFLVEDPYSETVFDDGAKIPPETRIRIYAWVDGVRSGPATITVGTFSTFLKGWWENLPTGRVWHLMGIPEKQASQS
jgi:hypothetical protein